MANHMKKIIVLISGSGSNLQAILDACAKSKIDGSVCAVISNRPNVMGLQRAVKSGCDAITLDHKQFPDRATFDAELQKRIDFYKPDLVVLAGFMRILTEGFVNHYLGRMVNIHPSLLPKYPGLNTHKRAIKAGDSIGGATVHYVTPELDGGPLILQAEVPIFTGDSELDLAKNVLQAEHSLYPTALELICNNSLTFAEGLPHFKGKPLQFPMKLNNTIG